MSEPEASDHAWAMAQQLERLILNARGALFHADPAANDIEFRAALLTAAAHVIVELAPPSADIERQAAAFSRILAEQMRRQTLRGERVTMTEQLLAAYRGPESA